MSSYGFYGSIALFIDREIGVPNPPYTAQFDFKGEFIQPLLRQAKLPWQDQESLAETSKKLGAIVSAGQLATLNDHLLVHPAELSALACLINKHPGAFEPDFLAVINPPAEDENSQDVFDIVAFDAWLDASCRDCEAHWSNHAGRIVIPCFSAGVTGRELQVRAYCDDPRSENESYLWDQVSFPSPVPAVALLVAACYLIDLTVLTDDAPHSFSPGPLFDYYPERFKQTRHYLKGARQEILDVEQVERSLNDQDRLNILLKHISVDVNEQQALTPLRARLASDRPMNSALTEEFERAFMHNSFVDCGRRIFQIHPELLAMFAHTNVNDIPVPEIQAPFSTCYLHFGKQDNIELEAGWFLDGAYVQHYPDKQLIQILLVTTPAAPADAANWARNLEPSNCLVISGDNYNKDLGSAIDELVKVRRRELETKISKGNTDVSGDIDAPPGLTVIDVAEQEGAKQLSELDRRIPCFEKALMLVANSLCYLTGYPDDLQQEWPAGTPSSLVDKARKGNPKMKKAALSKLESHGYRKIYLAGRALRQGPTDNPGREKRSIRSHWRRGHWKRQPHGPGKSLRKWVMIMPTLVAAGGEEPQGAIYIGENIADFKEKRRRMR